MWLNSSSCSCTNSPSPDVRDTSRQSPYKSPSHSAGVREPACNKPCSTPASGCPTTVTPSIGEAPPPAPPSPPSPPSPCARQMACAARSAAQAWLGLGFTIRARAVIWARVRARARVGVRVRVSVSVRVRVRVSVRVRVRVSVRVSVRFEVRRNASPSMPVEQGSV